MRDDLQDPYYRPRSNAFATMTLFVTGISIGMVVVVAVKSCDRQTEPVVVKVNCAACHNRQTTLTEYFRKAGSRSPEDMADAVLNTRSPRLLAAVAVVESGGNPTVRNAGYKRRHDGAFQVNPRLHGRVSTDPIKQALQAESILCELAETMPIKKALSVYGGDSTSKYQRRVLAELTRVP